MTITYQDTSKTVYSLVWPETRRIMQDCFGDFEKMIMRHDAPHKKYQDAFGPDFARSWWQWAGVCEKSSDDLFSYFYPTNGASEALREIINELARYQGTLIVFDGDYEGYGAIAEGAGVTVCRLNRSRWQEEWAYLAPLIKSPCQFWVSNPSSLDGCFWNDFDLFCQTVSHPLVEIWVDLTYIGATPTKNHRLLPALENKNIAGVVFSLSKPAGMYYRRIGGCFSRRFISGLYGNQWFKNIDGLFLGQAFIENIPRGFLPDKYQPQQKKIIDLFNRFSNERAKNWKQSEVVLLAYSSVSHCYDDRHDPSFFKRSAGFYRLCLTPALHKLIIEGERLE